MSRLISAMALMHEVFEEHAKGDGKLNKAELSKMLLAELGIKLGNNKEVDGMFGMIDSDGSGEVDFKEYVTFVVALTTMLKESD